MRWSDERILTTHTGSLPRPPELTRLYVRRARGEAIDCAELDRVQGGIATDRRQADRSRCRYRQQRRAATRGVFSLRPASDERFRRQLAALAARRCRTISASQARDGADARRARGCGQLAATQGDWRSALRRRRRIKCRDCRFSRCPRSEAKRLGRAVHDHPVARDHCRRNEERITSPLIRRHHLRSRCRRPSLEIVATATRRAIAKAKIRPEPAREPLLELKRYEPPRGLGQGNRCWNYARCAIAFGRRTIF